jgi:hypothetical protein
MARNGRFQLALGLALGASLAFLAFLLARPVGDGAVQLTANLAQLVAPLVAAASCAWAAAAGSGRNRRAWALLAWSAGSWAVGQATWVWYEHVARRELPFPSLADVGYLLAIPLAAAAMLAFPGRTERAALQARSLLDGAVIAASLLYTSWAFVLGPVFRAGEGSVLEQAIALAYPAGDVVLVTIVFVVVARIRVGGVPVLLLGAGLVSLAVADTGFAYLTQEGAYQTGSPTDVGWFAGYLLVAVAAFRPAAVGMTWVGGRPGRFQVVAPYVPLALAVTTSVVLQLRGQASGPFLYCSSSTSTTSRRSTTSWATPPATTSWSTWPPASRPACATRTPSPASAATSSPSSSSRPPATRSRSGWPGASWRRCGRRSSSTATRFRSGPASA